MKKYGQLFIGVIIGILISSVAFANEIKTYMAEIADFPIVVNGETVNLDMPAVTIEGRTYLPLRALGNILGIDVSWNDEKRQVEIKTEEISTKGINTMAATTTGKYTPSNDVLNNKEHEYIIIGEHGEYYATARYIDHILYSAGYRILTDYSNETKDMSYTKNEGEPITIKFDIFINDRAVIPYDDFVDNILPLVE